jgi:hypothetical protein
MCALIFVILLIPIWALNFVPLTMQQKFLATGAAAGAAILVTLFHPALQD